MEELKKILKEKTITFGSEKTLKKIRKGDVKKVFLASNCDENTRKTVERYAKIGKFEVIKLDIPNEEVGIVCKKPFAISVLCY